MDVTLTAWDGDRMVDELDVSEEWWIPVALVQVAEHPDEELSMAAGGVGEDDWSDLDLTAVAGFLRSTDLDALRDRLLSSDYALLSDPGMPGDEADAVDQLRSDTFGDCVAFLVDAADHGHRVTLE